VENASSVPDDGEAKGGGAKEVDGHAHRDPHQGGRGHDHRRSPAARQRHRLHARRAAAGASAGRCFPAPPLPAAVPRARIIAFELGADSE